MKLNWKIWLALGLPVLFLIIAEIVRPVKLNWSDDYRFNSDLPLGSEVLFNLLPDYFPDHQIVQNFDPLFDELDHFQGDSLRTLFIVNDDFNPDEALTNKLLSRVNDGHSVFIAGRPGGILLDTLGLDDDYNWDISNEPIFRILNDQVGDSIGVDNFVTLIHDNPYLTDTTNIPIGHIFYRYFDEVDTLNTTLLGHFDYQSASYPYFIKVQHGAGNFYIHLLPQLLGNYFVLADSARYLSSVMANLPKSQPVHWDDSNKPKTTQPQTPLRVILSNESLSLAWYTLIFGGLIFMIFGVKRRQRIIPIIKPPINATLTFIETLGRLYYKHQDHHKIAGRRILFLLDYIRSHYYLPTNKLDADFVKRLAGRTNIPEVELAILINQVKKAKENPNINKTELMSLNKMIEDFYDQVRPEIA